MTQLNYGNRTFEATIAGGGGIGSTTIALSGSGLGTIPPFPFIIEIDHDNSLREICLVTSGTATSLNVQRGYDGTSEVGHANGANVRHSASAETLNKIETHAAATSDVHGVTGALVGATSTQTLTNKTLTASVTNVKTSEVAPSSGAVHHVEMDQASAEHAFAVTDTGSGTGDAFRYVSGGVRKVSVDSDGKIILNSSSGTDKVASIRTGDVEVGYVQANGNVVLTNATLTTVTASGAVSTGPLTVTGQTQLNGEVDTTGTIEAAGSVSAAVDIFGRAGKTSSYTSGGHFGWQSEVTHVSATATRCTRQPWEHRLQSLSAHGALTVGEALVYDFTWTPKTTCHAKIQGLATISSGADVGGGSVTANCTLRLKIYDNAGTPALLESCAYDFRDDINETNDDVGNVSSVHLQFLPDQVFTAGTTYRIRIYGLSTSARKASVERAMLIVTECVRGT